MCKAIASLIEHSEITFQMQKLQLYRRPLPSSVSVRSILSSRRRREQPGDRLRGVILRAFLARLLLVRVYKSFESSRTSFRHRIGHAAVRLGSRRWVHHSCVVAIFVLITRLRGRVRNYQHTGLALEDTERLWGRHVLA